MRRVPSSSRSAAAAWPSRVGSLAWAALLGAVLVLWLAPRGARACSCRPPAPPESALQDADAVFEARAFIMNSDGQRARYGFEVDRVWKGDVGPRVEIATALHSATCGRSFAIGTRYVVYAQRGPSGEWTDNLCSRTRPSSSAAEDLGILGAGHDPRSGAAEPSATGPSSGPTEPPRIPPPSAGPPSAGPPPTEPSRRGCAVEKPHGPAGPLGLGLLGLFAVAIGRRRAVRSPTRRRATPRPVRPTP